MSGKVAPIATESPTTILVLFIYLPKVKEHATLPARARVDHGVRVNSTD